MSIEYIVVIAIALVGVALVLEKAKKQSTSGPTPTHPASADESGPTETGKFRVQQMLKSTTNKAGSQTDEDEEGPLPDPMKKR